MSDVKAISPCDDSQPAEILNMINMIERADRDLSALGRSEEMNNSTIVSLIESIIPKSIENDWLDVVSGREKENIRIKFPELPKVLPKHKE